MEEFFSQPWRVYPAASLIIGGLIIAFIGSKLAYGAIRIPRSGPATSLDLLRGFRFMVIGIAVAHLGAAWAWLVVWPLVFALVFIGEEMLEISFMIATVRRSRRRLG